MGELCEFMDLFRRSKFQFFFKYVLSSYKWMDLVLEIMEK